MYAFKKGDIVKCSVTGVEDYGIFVRVCNDCYGLIHISEINHGFVKNVSDYASVGDEIYAMVIEEINDSENKLKLSIKNIDYKNSGKINRIIESKNGFIPLKECLPVWTKEKIDELSQQ